MMVIIGKLILVISIAVFYTMTFALCKASGNAERRYKELAAKKFGTPGGDVNAV